MAISCSESAIDQATPSPQPLSRPARRSHRDKAAAPGATQRTPPADLNGSLRAYDVTGGVVGHVHVRRWQRARTPAARGTVDLSYTAINYSRKGILARKRKNNRRGWNTASFSLKRNIPSSCTKLLVQMASKILHGHIAGSWGVIIFINNLAQLISLPIISLYTIISLFTIIYLFLI